MLSAAIIDSNELFRCRLADKLLADHTDKIEIDTYSSIESYPSQEGKKKHNVLLIDSEFANESLTGFGDAQIIFLVDDKQIESLHGRPVIFRYQNSKLIYKSILNLCAELDAGATWRSEAIGDMGIITFFSTGGGSGASALAAACAIAAARQGKRVFYLNLELFGQSSTFFSAPGTGCLDEVLFAIFAKRANAAMRIQAVTRQTTDGVSYIESCTHSRDIVDLTPERFEQLVRGIVTSAEYDLLIFDLDFAYSPLASKAIAMSTETVFVSNGTLVANQKFERIYDFLASRVASGDIPGLSNVVLAYNNYSSKTGRQLKDGAVPIIGGAHRFVTDNNDIRTLINSLSNTQVVNDILLKIEEA